MSSRHTALNGKSRTEKKSFALTHAEFIYLLHEQGVASPKGLTSDLFPAPAKGAGLDQILRTGETKLTERGLVTVHDNRAHINSDLHVMMHTVARPMAAVTAAHPAGGQQPQFLAHYASASTIIQLSPVDHRAYRLTTLADASVMLEQIERLLPLTPANLRHRAVLTTDDFINVISLAESWEQGPATEIMVSDGLDHISADEFFDALTEPKWRGEIVFLSFQKSDVVTRWAVQVVEGQELSWIGRVAEPGEAGTMIIESVQPGLLREILTQFWMRIKPEA